MSQNKETFLYMNSLLPVFLASNLLSLLLGLVMLVLAVEFGKKMPTLGLDLSTDKVSAFRRYKDPTGEVSSDDLKQVNQLQYHSGS